MAQRLHHRQVRVLELDVLADQRDLHRRAALGLARLAHEPLPAAQLRRRASIAEVLEDEAVDALGAVVERDLVDVVDVLAGDDRVPDEIEVGVLNGGTTDETDVVVAFELLGSTESVEGEKTIPRINPAEEGTAVIPVNGEIPEGDDLTLIVTVYPVAGEAIVDNNEAAYQVRFGG